MFSGGAQRPGGGYMLTTLSVVTVIVPWANAPLFRCWPRSAKITIMAQIICVDEVCIYMMHLKPFLNLGQPHIPPVRQTWVFWGPFVFKCPGFGRIGGPEWPNWGVWGGGGALQYRGEILEQDKSCVDKFGA